jgi:signal peptidase II
MRKNNGIWLWLSLAIIIADVLTKAWIKKIFFVGQSYTVLPFFNLTLRYNHGIAFSLFNRANPLIHWLLVLFIIAIIVGLLFWLKTASSKRSCLAIGLALIIGGALGNMLSRLYYGYVIDFIDLHIGLWHWPAFNVADSAIVLGALLLFIDAYCLRKKT